MDTSCGEEYEKKLRDYVAAQEEVVRVDVFAVVCSAAKYILIWR